MNDETTKNEYYDVVTNNYLTIGKTPKGIDNVIFRIKYKYKNKKYICLSTCPNIDIENEKKIGMKFTMPIKEVRLLDSENNLKHVVTKKYMKLIGPYNNFHNVTNLIISDLFFMNDYEYIEIIHITNQALKLQKETNLKKTLELKKK